jgi:hypothetical protein
MSRARWLPDRLVDAGESVRVVGASGEVSEHLACRCRT